MCPHVEWVRPHRVSLLLLVFVPLFTAACPVLAVDIAKVDDALAKARTWLYAEQKNGDWEQPAWPDGRHGDQSGGYTALAVYALLVSGESHNDPRLQQATEFLRKTNSTGVYALGLRCQVWLLLPPTNDNKRMMAHDAQLLLNSIKRQGKGKGMYAYNPEGKATSHSRAQYGVLGIWAAAQMGIDVPTWYWELVEKSWIENQHASGGWTYQVGMEERYGITPGMTAVGVATLFITQEYLHANDGVLARGNLRSPPIERGMKWMTDNFDKVATDQQYSRDWPYPTLYAVERIGLAGGHKYFGTIDWYEKGANWLLRKQRKDGAWWEGSGDTGRLGDTCFAMLFLARGKAPVAMNKLDYTLEGKKADWNQRPRDVANITRWTGRQMERELNWQIVNLAAPAADWHDAPVLYLSGDDPLDLDEPAQAKLKRFVEQGGLILANADGAGRAFVTSFTKLGKKLFPSYEFRELPEEHSIYTAQQFARSGWKTRPSLLGLSNGARELMLIVPQADPAKSWQLQLTRGREELFELAANVIQYAASKTHLRGRGQSHLVETDPKIKPTGTIQLARLEYAGNWDPEPGGWRRLAGVMHNMHKRTLQVTTARAGETIPGKLAHLTGTGPLNLTEPQRASLREFVEAGGTLIIDAAGGDSAFATGAEQELARLFPDAKLQVLAPDHPLFTAGGTKAPPIEYRPAASRLLGALKGPRLQAIELKGRPAVFYSREDLSVGLVGTHTDGIVGYAPETASALMARILLLAGG